MGCDIHMYVEVYASKTSNDLDNKLNVLMGNMGYDGYKKFETWSKVGDIFQGWQNELTDNPYNGRNYTLFGILAGVRGTEQYFGIRGLPDDVSNEVQDLSDRDGQDGHTHNYVYLAELEEFLKSPNFKRLQNDLDTTFINYTIPELRKLGSPMSVRIVFWFDN